MDKILQQLCQARGIAGNEEEVREIVLSHARPFAEKIEVTPLGTVLVYKKGRERAKTRLVLDAHMDEVGLIVTHVCEDGLLKFAAVGGIDPRVLPGRSVTVGRGQSTVSGVIGVKPIHVLSSEERGKSVPMDELSIDIGAEKAAQALEVVTPGDPVTFDSLFADNGSTLMSRALDDRAGCALLLHLLAQEDWPYDCIFEFSVQEETGGAGARTGVFQAKPEAAIVVESTTAADVPGNEESAQVCRLGQGPVISFMDRGSIYDQAYCRLAFAAAKEARVPCQWKEAVAGGNNAMRIHPSRNGVRCVSVSLPCRYLHAPMAVESKADYEAALPLLAKLAEKIAGGQG